MFEFLQSPIWQLITISDWISKYIILLGLFCMSVMCVALIIYKATMFFHEKKQISRLLQQCGSIKSISELSVLSTTFKGSMGGDFLAQSLSRLKNLIEQKNDISKKTLSGKELEHLEILLSQEVSNALNEQETYLPILGTSASVSPLIGLFGTIWGLINAFISIGQEKSADIATVAPGIASALLTTLAGLMVAIPAMIAFHYFSNHMRRFEMQLHDLHDIFMLTVRQKLQ